MSGKIAALVEPSKTSLHAPPLPRAHKQSHRPYHCLIAFMKALVALAGPDLWSIMSSLKS